MTFRPMGDGHNGTTSYRKEVIQVPYCYNRLLHEVGRSRANNDNHRNQDYQHTTEDRSLQVWHFKRNHIRQWEAV